MPCHTRSLRSIVLTLLLVYSSALTPAPARAATGSSAAPPTRAPSGLRASADRATWTGSRLNRVAGVSHGCQLVEDGSGRCWGRTGWGHSGDGPTTRSTPTPVRLEPLLSITDSSGAEGNSGPASQTSS